MFDRRRFRVAIESSVTVGMPHLHEHCLTLPMVRQVAAGALLGDGLGLGRPCQGVGKRLRDGAVEWLQQRLCNDGLIAAMLPATARYPSR